MEATIPELWSMKLSIKPNQIKSDHTHADIYLHVLFGEEEEELRLFAPLYV